MKKIFHRVIASVTKIVGWIRCAFCTVIHHVAYRNMVDYGKKRLIHPTIFVTLTMTMLIVMCVSPLSSLAAEDMYQFKTTEQQQQFTTLTTQLRCLVCQNQNIAQSNAPLANDLRDQIYQKILHNQSNQDIITYLTARYGNYVLYRPPFDYATLGLWLGPFVILLSGVSYLLFYLRKKSRE